MLKTCIVLGLWGVPFFSQWVQALELQVPKQKVMIFVLDGIRPMDVSRTTFPELYRVLDRKNKSKVFGLTPKTQPCLVSNPYRISLPAYSDMLSGIRQETVTENNLRRPLTHPTWIDQFVQKGMPGSWFSVFTSWERIAEVVSQTVIPEGMMVSSGLHPGETPPPWHDARYDTDTIKQIDRYFFEEKHHPTFSFVVFNDTDEWAHENQFERYTQAIRADEKYIASFIQQLESDPFYREQTTYLVTTDHGRGTTPETFHGHGSEVEGAQYIWAFLIPPSNAQITFDESEILQQCTQLGLNRMVMQLL